MLLWKRQSIHFMIYWRWVKHGGVGGLTWVGSQIVSVWNHNFTRQNLKSERAACLFSGIESKQLLSVLFFFVPHLSPLVSFPFFLHGLTRCRAISQQTLESMSHVHPRPFERGIHSAAHLGKHPPLSSVFLREMKAAPARRAVFVTKATCWTGQPVVRQERSLWRTQVLGCPLACPSVSITLPAGHLYNCNFT